MKLNTEPNIADPDAFYERLIQTHADLSDAQSLQLNERLAALLSEQVNAPAVVLQAQAIAAEDATAGSADYVAELVLLLSNHIGEMSKIDAALSRARTCVGA
jgi:Lon protease-like protein